MWMPPVVVIHQVTTDIPLCFPQVHVSRGRQPLRLQAPEQPLHRCIVPAVSTPAHTLGHAIAPQSLPKCPAAILTALVGVKQHTGWATPLLISHLQCSDCQLCIRLARHHPDVGDIATPHHTGLGCGTSNSRASRFGISGRSEHATLYGVRPAVWMPAQLPSSGYVL